MKTVWIAGLAIAATTSAFAQSTIYKHVDDSGRITYSNKPMKGAVEMELEPLTTIPSTPAGMLVSRPGAPAEKAEAREDTPKSETARSPGPKAEARPALAVVTPLPANNGLMAASRTTLASIEPQVQRRRDNERRRILDEELAREEQSLTGAREALLQERQNPRLITAVRLAQQAQDPTPSQMAEFRNNIDKASGRIRGLQATVAEHEKNIEALKKELGALKP